MFFYAYVCVCMGKPAINSVILKIHFYTRVRQQVGFVKMVFLSLPLLHDFIIVWKTVLIEARRHVLFFFA